MAGDLIDDSSSGVQEPASVGHGFESVSTNPNSTSNSLVGDVNCPQDRQIGLVSAVFIVLNRMIGSGIFATPSTILGLRTCLVNAFAPPSFHHWQNLTFNAPCRFMWLFGAFIASTGMWTYITWGTAIPQNGGEKNYLEYLFRKPKLLITCVYAANAILLAWAAGASLVFGEYILVAANWEPSRWTLRLVGFACITFATLIHGTSLKWGLRLQNFFGFFKIAILLVVITSGIVALSGHLNVERPDNFSHVFQGTTGSASSLCLSLYNVIWSFSGFSNLNCALSDVQNLSRTIRTVGPLAISVVTVLYILANIAYLAGASKEDITNSGRFVASLLFRNVYGPRAERTLSAFVALSAFGNVLSVMFSQGRVNQALGQEGVLPFSKFWASNRPFGAPLAGLAIQWAVCLIVIFGLPPGDAYNFVINVISYPLSVINAAISCGIAYLAFWPYPDWPKVGLWAQVAAVFFGSANVFLFLVPLMKPPPGAEPYLHLPFWTHAMAGWCVLGLGFLYWVVWTVGQMRKDGLARHGFRRLHS